MPIRVNLPGGETLVFPDNVTQDQITEIVNQRATPSPAEPEIEEPKQGFVGAAWDQLNPVNAVMGVAHAVANPLETAKGLYRAHADQAGKAAESAGRALQVFKRPLSAASGRDALLDATEAIGHGAAALLPGIGPAAAHAGERIGSGDIAGGLGESVGLIASASGGPRLAMKGAQKGLEKLGAANRWGAEKSIKSAMKIDRGYLEKMAGGRDKNLIAKEAEIVNTVLDDTKGNLLTRGGINRVSDTLDDLETQYGNKVDAAPNVPIAGQGNKALRAAGKVRRDVSQGYGYEGDRAAVQKLMDEMKTSKNTSTVRPGRSTYREVPAESPQKGGAPTSFTNWNQASAAPESGQFWHTTDNASRQTGTFPVKPGPPTRMIEEAGKPQRAMLDLTPRQLRAAMTADNKRLAGMFNGQTKDAEIWARLAVKRANQAALDDVAKTGEITDKMRRLIDVRNVANIAGRRADAANPFSLTDFISLNTGRGGILLASQGMKSPVLFQIGRALDATGKGLKKAGAAAGSVKAVNAARAAALARLLAQQSEEPQQ